MQLALGDASALGMTSDLTYRVLRRSRETRCHRRSTLRVEPPRLDSSCDHLVKPDAIVARLSESSPPDAEARDFSVFSVFCPCPSVAPTHSRSVHFS